MIFASCFSLIFLLILRSIKSAAFINYTSLENLEDVLNYVSDDFLAMIVSRLYSETSAIYYVDFSHLYLLNRTQLIDLIISLYKMGEEFPDPPEFNEKIKYFPNLTEPWDFISRERSRFIKIRWVLNGENYRIKKKDKPVVIGGLSQYVNYLNYNEINDYLFNLIKLYPELNNRELFEAEIMNLNLIKNTILKQIYTEDSKEFLLKMCLNLFNFLHMGDKEMSDVTCQEINTIFSYANNSELLVKYLVDNSKNILGIDVPIFIKITYYDYHKFINNKDVLIQFNIEELRKYALLAEEYNRKNTLTNSFKYINEYILHIPKDNLTDYVVQQIERYPELSNLERFEDMSKIQTSLAASSLITKMNAITHEELLRWVLNLKKFYEINIEKKNDKKSMEDFTDSLYYLSDSYIKEKAVEIIFELSNSNITNDLNNVVNPNPNKNQEFMNYLQLFPINILNKWYKNLVIYKQERVIEKGDSGYEYLYDKSELLSRIKEYLERYNELNSLDHFCDVIDNDGESADIYSSFPDYARLHSLEELKIWLVILENYYRKKSNTLNIHKFSDTKKIDKEYLINQTSFYFYSFPEFNKNMEKFHNLVGSSDFIRKIYSINNITELSEIAKKFYMYYNILNFRIRRFDYTVPQSEFDKFLKNKNENQIKMFILKIAKYYPELTIETIFEQVVELPYISSDNSITQMVEYVNNIQDRDELKSITYKFLRLNKARIPISKRTPEDVIDIESGHGSLKDYCATVIVMNSYDLSFSWSFPRLIYGQTHVLYGGLTSLFERQTNETLSQFYKNLMNKLPMAYNYTSQLEFDEYSHDMKVNYLFSIIESVNELFFNFEKVYSIFSFKKIEDISGGEISFDKEKLNKETLVSYALVCEYYKRKKRRRNGINPVETYFMHFHDMTWEELEHFIASNYQYIKGQMGSGIGGFKKAAFLLGLENTERYYTVE